MKIKKLFCSLVLCFSVTTIFAQNSIPEGYVKSTIHLFDGTILNGFVKDNIKKSAAVFFIAEAGDKKKQYDADLINEINIGEVNYICISGDFFKSICTGKLNFIQKQSNASNKASYNGSEAVFNSGTEGSIGDFFVYTNKTLTRISKKTVATFISTNLAACAEAVEKAKAINGDLAKLQQPIEIFNNYSNK